MERTGFIYIIDGDVSARRGLSKLLTTAGYDVSPFASFQEFLDAGSVDSSGCIIMDVWLSGFSESNLKDKLIRNNVHLPVIFLSARDDRESRARAHGARAEGFFRKPIDGAALLDAIGWTLETHARNKKIGEDTDSGTTKESPRP
jgi:FixJ family two-component response regulator